MVVNISEALSGDLVSILSNIITPDAILYSFSLGFLLLVLFLRKGYFKEKVSYESNGVDKIFFSFIIGLPIYLLFLICINLIKNAIILLFGFSEIIVLFYNTFFVLIIIGLFIGIVKKEDVYIYILFFGLPLVFSLFGLLFLSSALTIYIKGLPWIYFGLFITFLLIIFFSLGIILWLSFLFESFIVNTSETKFPIKRYIIPISISAIIILILSFGFFYFLFFPKYDISTSVNEYVLGRGELDRAVEEINYTFSGWGLVKWRALDISHFRLNETKDKDSLILSKISGTQKIQIARGFDNILHIEDKYGIQYVIYSNSTFFLWLNKKQINEENITGFSISGNVYKDLRDEYSYDYRWYCEEKNCKAYRNITSNLDNNAFIYRDILFNLGWFGGDFDRCKLDEISGNYNGTAFGYYIDKIPFSIKESEIKIEEDTNSKIVYIGRYTIPSNSNLFFILTMKCS